MGSPARWMSWVAFGALALALGCALLWLLSGLATRAEWVHYSTGLRLFRWSTTLALPVGLLALAVLVTTLMARASWTQRLVCVAALAIAAGTYLPGHVFRARAAAVPAIHDITTDTQNPPPFEAVVPLRGEEANPVEYAGEEVAEQQRAAYPHLAPVTLELPREQALARALEAAESLGWRIVDVDEPRGRIEATDTTFFFGFKDDVVIRVSADAADPDRSRIDVRSISRVGRSDVGANARRIERFLEQLQATRP